MLPLYVHLEVQHLGVTVGTLLLWSVHVGLHVEGERGLQHVFLAIRTKDFRLSSVLATNLHMRNDVMFSYHLLAHFTGVNKDIMVGMFKVILNIDILHILLADWTRCLEEDLRLALEAF